MRYNYRVSNLVWEKYTYCKVISVNYLLPWTVIGGGKFKEYEHYVTPYSYCIYVHMYLNISFHFLDTLYICCLSVRLSLCLYVCLSVCLYVCLPAFLFCVLNSKSYSCLSPSKKVIFLWIHISFLRFVCLSACLSVVPFVYTIPVPIFTCRSVCLYVAQFPLLFAPL